MWYVMLLRPLICLSKIIATKVSIKGSIKLSCDVTLEITTTPFFTKLLIIAYLLSISLLILWCLESFVITMATLLSGNSVIGLSIQGITSKISKEVAKLNHFLRFFTDRHILDFHSRVSITSLLRKALHNDVSSKSKGRLPNL